MNIKNDILWRIYLAFFAVALIAFLIVAQAFRVQVVEGEKWTSLADSLTTGFKTIPAERGNIFSEDGKLLASSLPSFEIRMDAASPALTDELFYANVDSLAYYMSSFIGKRTQNQYKEYLVNARKNGKRYLLIKRDADFRQLKLIKTWPIFNRGRFKGGLITVQINKRERPFGSLAHRTIGYVRTGEGAQSVGIEANYDNFLSGQDGKRLMQKINGGIWVPINAENEIEPKNGSDLITTLDVNFQDLVENALIKALEKHNAHHGSVILMEVETGKIKAIANLGKSGKNTYFENYNYAVGEATEPGSTFKLATMMALLEDRKVKLTDSVDIGYGEVWFYGRKMRDAKPHNYGVVTIERAFCISSNVGITKLAHKNYNHQPEAFINHLKDFGLGQTVFNEVKGEPKPLIKSPGDEGWSKISIPWMSVGYELTITPLQTLTFFNAVANNGKMMKPYLVKEIQEYGKPRIKIKPEVIKKRICSESTIRDLKILLEGVVEKGTAKNLRNKNYSIAGKTGTAKIAKGRTGYADKVYQASFAGYFPADNPKYSCIVVINAPSNGIYYGGSVAAPVFKEIADKIYSTKILLDSEQEQTEEETQTISYKGFEPDFAKICDELGLKKVPEMDAEWIRATIDSTDIQIKEFEMKDNLVPDVRGMGLKDAIYLLENKGMSVKVIGKGKVRKQSIRYGTPITRGMGIKIELAR